MSSSIIYNFLLSYSFLCSLISSLLHIYPFSNICSVYVVRYMVGVSMFDMTREYDTDFRGLGLDFSEFEL